MSDLEKIRRAKLARQFPKGCDVELTESAQRQFYQLARRCRSRGKVVGHSIDGDSIRVRPDNYYSVHRFNPIFWKRSDRHEQYN
jgi:hypothetical protein